MFIKGHSDYFRWYRKMKIKLKKEQKKYGKFSRGRKKRSKVNRV